PHVRTVHVRDRERGVDDLDPLAPTPDLLPHVHADGVLVLPPAQADLVHPEREVDVEHPREPGALVRVAARHDGPVVDLAHRVLRVERAVHRHDVDGLHDSFSFRFACPANTRMPGPLSRSVFLLTAWASGLREPARTPGRRTASGSRARHGCSPTPGPSSRRCRSRWSPPPRSSPRRAEGSPPPRSATSCRRRTRSARSTPWPRSATGWCPRSAP